MPCTSSTAAIYCGSSERTILIAPGQDKTLIDVSSLKSGIYLLKVMEGEKVIGVEKVVVQ